MKIKICGVTRREDAATAADLGAWAVGMILAPGGPRSMTIERAAEVREGIPKGTLAIGVFMDSAPDDIRRAVDSLRLGAIQLHGVEPPGSCLGFAVPVYKAISPLAFGEIDSLEAYKVAGFLFEAVRRLPGGRERLADEELHRRWDLARDARRLGPVILAGNLSPENVADAILRARPDGVDVAGGVESSPGVKDPARLKAFFQAVRAAEPVI